MKPKFVFWLMAGVILLATGCSPSSCEQAMLDLEFSPEGENFEYEIDYSIAQDGSDIRHGVIFMNEDGTATDTEVEDPEWKHVLEPGNTMFFESTKGELTQVRIACGQLWSHSQGE